MIQAKIAATCLLIAFSVVGCFGEERSSSAPIAVYPVEFTLYPDDSSSSDSLNHISCRPIEDSGNVISCDRVTVTFERPTLREISHEEVQQHLLLLSPTCSSLDRLDPNERANGYRSLRMDKEFPAKLCFSVTQEEKEQVILDFIYRSGGHNPRNCSPNIEFAQGEVYEWDGELDGWVHEGDRYGACEIKTTRRLQGYSKGYAWTYSEHRTLEHPNRDYVIEKLGCDAQIGQDVWDTRGYAFRHCERIGESWSK